MKTKNVITVKQVIATILQHIFAIAIVLSAILMTKTVSFRSSELNIYTIKFNLTTVALLFFIAICFFGAKQLHKIRIK